MFTFRSDSSSCRGTSDGSLDSQTSSHVDDTASVSTSAKMDSNHNSSLGSFNQDLASETSTMSDGENSVATAVEGRGVEDYASDDNVDNVEQRLND